MNTLFKRLTLFLTLCVVLLVIPVYGKKEKKHKKVEAKEVKRTHNTETLINNLYAGASGFSIPKSEEDLITQKGGAHTYGEIIYESEKKLLDEAPADLKENGVFYDYGSGIGKTCVQAYLDYPFKKVVGIELSHKRFSSSQEVKHELKKQGLLEKGRSLEFVQKDFMQVKPKDATIIYMCSTCYSAELMHSLLIIFAESLKKGARVITLKPFELYTDFGFVEIKEYKLPMTWSKDIGGSPVHVYEYRDTIKGKKQAKTEKKKSKKKKRY